MNTEVRVHLILMYLLPCTIILARFLIVYIVDGNIYIWHKETEILLETLSGHAGSCNSVVWHPHGKYTIKVV